MKNTLPIELSDYARTQRNEATEWLENQKEGLSDRFNDALEETLDTISENPLLGTPYEGELLRKKLFNSFKTWKYAVYYRIEDARIIILAINHAKQDSPPL